MNDDTPTADELNAMFNGETPPPRPEPQATGELTVDQVLAAMRQGADQFTALGTETARVIGTYYANLRAMEIPEEDVSAMGKAWGFYYMNMVCTQVTQARGE